MSSLSHQMKAGYFVPEDLTLSCSAMVDGIGGWPLRGLSLRARGSASMPECLLQLPSLPSTQPSLPVVSAFPKKTETLTKHLLGAWHCARLWESPR